MLPQVDHVVVLMLENHSFDNLLGVLGRGDGFTLGADGLPTATNPYGKARVLHAFHMPTPCQLHNRPSQTWNASRTRHAAGAMDGFVTARAARSRWVPRRDADPARREACETSGAGTIPPPWAVSPL